MIVFLVGMTGSGKSTLGRELAELMSFDFVDMDEEIVKDQGMSIEQIFNRKGENYFRTLESNFLKLALFRDSNCIISTGGGVACFNENMKLINSCKYAVSIWLNVSAEEIGSRLFQTPNKENRPLVKGKSLNELIEFAKNKIEERRSFYELSTYTASSDSLTCSDLFNLIKK